MCLDVIQLRFARDALLGQFTKKIVVPLSAWIGFSGSRFVVAVSLVGDLLNNSPRIINYQAQSDLLPLSVLCLTSLFKGKHEKTQKYARIMKKDESKFRSGNM